MRIAVRAAFAAACLTPAAAGAASPNTEPQPLDLRLAAEPPGGLVRDALREGDAARGAVLFYRTYLACATCHTPGTSGRPLGPDLARERRGLTDAEVVRSVLDPSHEVRKGYETVTVATTDGRTLTGLVAEDRPDALVLRDPFGVGTVAVPKASIEARRDGGPSAMPAGLVNALPTRREALDLFRYLIEINRDGPSRAIELKPTPWEVAGPPLPSYEARIDHAGMIASLGPESLRRGEESYLRACASCHGTTDAPGSMPTALRFVSGAFKNGSDPFAMYRTLTHGYGQMPPQTRMTPEQRYDVIHYVREAILKPRNPARYAAVTADYLAGLPKGALRGPRATAAEPWREADRGPSLMLTVQAGAGGPVAYKGIAVRLDPGPGGVARGRRFVVYDHDTMQLVAAWTGAGFIDWNGINFNGRHETHPATAGDVRVRNADPIAWADPATGSFADPRARGRDGRPYGPLPRAWLRFRGLYHHGDRVVLAYTVRDADVLESPRAVAPAGEGPVVFARALNVGRSSHDLALKVAPAGPAVSVVGDDRVRLVEDEAGARVVRIPASATPLALSVLVTDGGPDALRSAGLAPEPLAPLTRGGPPRWPQRLTTRVETGADDGPFAADTLTAPEDNPWACQFRFGGFDFFADGRRAAACTWDGDVWTVSGLDDPAGPLTWRRVASGLFQPLGLKIVGGRVFVACRDQIVTLHDLNGDGETDFYEAFNSDHQVTEHFHEFATGLQTDASGNFYYAKGTRHGKPALVPQHGTLLKVDRDGSATEILARGFRAPNGVCLNPDGTFYLSDQEGHWVPKNRINHVVRGGFYGNMWGYQDVTNASDAAAEPPLCWVTNAMDRSPAELLWVEGAGAAWGPLKGSLLSLSYGYGKVFVVPHERLGGRVQGGLCALPIRPFPTGLVRGRFHPHDGNLYVCGMYAWAGNQTAPGGFYRIRATGQPMHVPVGLHAYRDGLDVTFTDPFDRTTAADPSRWAVRVWSLRRSANYGSPHVDEHSLRVAAVQTSDDSRTARLAIPGITPTMSMQIAYELRGTNGALVDGKIHNTIHALGPARVEADPRAGSSETRE